MKIVCIADLHGMEARINGIPNGDVLVVAGDITKRGGFHELLNFNVWLGKQPHAWKIVIAGNHDWCLQEDPEAHKHITNGVYLQDQWYVIDGVKFYGSPWQPDFCNWAFNLPRGKPLADKWAMIPEDTDVLVTHGPPFGILNHNIQGEHVGCEDLLRKVILLQPKAHIFGHVHEAYGIHTKHDTQFVNASICDVFYDPVNRPIVIEV